MQGIFHELGIAACLSTILLSVFPPKRLKRLNLTVPAARLAQEDTVALCTGGYALTWVAGLDADTALIDRALALDPNLAAAWHLSDWVRLLPASPNRRSSIWRARRAGRTAYRSYRR